MPSWPLEWKWEPKIRFSLWTFWPRRRLNISSLKELAQNLTAAGFSGQKKANSKSVHLAIKSPSDKSNDWSPKFVVETLTKTHKQIWRKESVEELQMAKEQPWIDVPIQILISHHIWKLPFNCEHKYDLWHHQWSKVFENIFKVWFQVQLWEQRLPGSYLLPPHKAKIMSSGDPFIIFS